MPDENDAAQPRHLKAAGAPVTSGAGSSSSRHFRSEPAPSRRSRAASPASGGQGSPASGGRVSPSSTAETPIVVDALEPTPKPVEDDPDNPYLQHEKPGKHKKARRSSTPRVTGVAANLEPDELREVRDRTSQRRRRNRYALVGGAIAAVALIALVVALVTGAVASPDVEMHDEATEAAAEAGGDAAAGSATVSLSAVGDNLMHTSVLNTADAAEGEVGDGQYDFTVLYEGIRDVIETHDINFIDIETPMGGDEKGIAGGDETSPSGAPVFNTPSSDAADIADFGFNLATTASNHVNDMGYDGIVSMAETWAEHPEVVVAGSYTSEEDRSHIRTFEKNGITFAFLAYTLAVNDALPEGYPDYAIAFAEDDVITEEVQRAHELADCVIVSMSWGAEHYMDIASDQRKYAQFLANLDVDLVIGFHPHVIGPVEWVEAKDAQLKPTGHRTLVAYSVGNLIGGMVDPINNVSGIFTCDFVRNGDGSVSVANPGWIPTVIHFSGGAGHRVYQLKDYTTELGYEHDVLSSVGDAVQYAKDLTLQAIDPQVVDIDWGDPSDAAREADATNPASGASSTDASDESSG